MAKRFTDTGKWKKPLLRSLQAPCKLLLLYIWDDCNHAGIWDVEMDIAKIRIGCPDLTIEKALAELGDTVVPIEDGAKWFIPAFIEFQYGQLNPENKVHASVLSILKSKGLSRSLQGSKDKDKDKGKKKEKAKEPEYPVLEKLVDPLREAVVEWINMRVQKKEPPTPHAVDLALKEAARASDKDQAKMAALFDKSTLNGWKGIFPDQQAPSGYIPPKTPEFSLSD